MTNIINDIAATYLHIDTLDTQHSDSLDFHDLPVWSLKHALSAAYQAGKAELCHEPSMLINAIVGVIADRTNEASQFAIAANAEAAKDEMNVTISYLAELKPLATSVASLCESALELHQSTNQGE